MQKKCADSAAAYWKNAGDDNKTDGFSTYLVHWNTKLNKCLILIREQWPNPYTKEPTTMYSKDLNDVLGGGNYADFMASQQFPSDKVVGGCWMNAAGDGAIVSGQRCKSEEEFDAYTSPFMTD